MTIMSQPSAAPRTSLTFITIGVLMAIPSGIWYAMFHPEGVAKFFSVSLFFVGLAFMIIGFSTGYIGRAARQAELPPTEVVGAVARQDQAIANRGMASPVAPAPLPCVGVPQTSAFQTDQPLRAAR